MGVVLSIIATILHLAFYSAALGHLIHLGNLISKENYEYNFGITMLGGFIIYSISNSIVLTYCDMRIDENEVSEDDPKGN